LNDIFFLDEGNKDNVGDMVNFLKCFMISEQIDQFVRFQNKQPRPFDEFTSTVKVDFGNIVGGRREGIEWMVNANHMTPTYKPTNLTLTFTTRNTSTRSPHWSKIKMPLKSH
jgi:hypothetical protein